MKVNPSALTFADVWAMIKKGSEGISFVVKFKDLEGNLLVLSGPESTLL